MSALERSTLSDQVYRELSGEILTGVYQPGDKLPTQRVLAERYGIHVNSVREAIQRLMQIGLVEVRHGDAVRAKDWRQTGTLAVLVQLLADQPTTNPKFLKAVMEARSAILIDSARLAAKRRNPEQLAKLSELSSELTDPKIDPINAQILDFQFLICLIESSDNIVYQLITNTLSEAYLAQAEFFAPVVKPIRELSKQYKKLVASIEQRDSEAAAIAAEKLAHLQTKSLLNSK